jgi:HPt (histidine-containing phosphotransfer) domain-containing protein
LIKKWTATEPVGPACGKVQKAVRKPIAKNTSAHKPIDLDRALNEFMGEKEVLNGILNEFTEKVRSQIKVIQRAIPGLDFKEIAKEAHSIKGGAANLTANRVAGIASALEKAAGLQQAELAEDLAGELEEKLQQLENYLQNENITAHGVLK